MWSLALETSVANAQDVGQPRGFGDPEEAAARGWIWGPSGEKSQLKPGESAGMPCRGTEEGPWETHGQEGRRRGAAGGVGG